MSNIEAYTEKQWVEKVRPLTENKRQRVLDSYLQTIRFIEKEESRSEDLRPVEAQCLLESNRAHAAKLLGWLEAGEMMCGDWE